MGIFEEKALPTLLADEGLWVLECDPDDTGGETWSGISRNNWPRWAGWAIIDRMKKSGITPKKHPEFGQLKALTESFYKQNFWDTYGCDELPYELAYEMFEQAVNLGGGRMVTNLQKVLNCLNRKLKNGTLEYGSDIGVDGKIGPKTRQRLKQEVANGCATAIQNGSNGFQCVHYVELGNGGNITRRKYTKGWLAKRGRGSA